NTATPAADAKNLKLEAGRYWKTPNTDGRGGLTLSVFAGSAQASSVFFRARVLDVKLDPLWIRNFGIDARFLTQPTLVRMSRVRHDAETDGAVRTTIQVNWANALMPLAMALFANILSLALFSYRVEFVKAFFLVLAGYASYLMMRTLVVIGDHSYLPSWLAAWTTPVLLILVSGAVLHSQEKGQILTRAQLTKLARAFPTLLWASR
ncbi:MAG: LptF/LptG family permease, partial [Alphaproteobacteria bacterium]|nr:LptF/LptG family permease [Alphaproteobacteria bacterium]